MSIPALYYIPSYGDDMYRYFVEMGVIKNYDNISSLLKAYRVDPFLIQHDINHANNYIYDVFQWIISRNGDFALLPFFSILIIYLCLFLPIIHQRIINKTSITQLLFEFILLLAIFPYYTCISTVRWNIASAIFFLLTYCIFNSKSHKLLLFLLYVVPLLIHPGVILPVIMVLICILTYRIHINWYFYLLVPIIVIIIYKFVSGGSSSVSQDLQGYNSTSSFQFIGNSGFALLWNIVSSIVPYIYLILSTILIKDNKGINYNIEKEFLILSLISELSLLVFSYAIFNRYALPIGIGSILIYLKTEKNNGVINKHIKHLYLVTSILCLIIIILTLLIKLHFNFYQINFAGLGQLY